MHTHTPTITETTAVVSDLETRYLSGGPDDGTPVVFLHDGAWGGSSDVTWGGVLPLAARDYRVIAPDLLGFGGSAKAVRVDVSPFAFRIRHVLSLLNSLGITQPVHLVGNSFGGSVGMRALGDLALRDRIASVATINGTGGPWRAPEMAKLGQFDGTEAGLAAIIDLLGDDTEGRAAHAEARMRWATAPGHYVTMMAPHTPVPETLQVQRPEDPYPSNLSDASTPVLLVQGVDDVLLQKDWPENLAQVLPQAEIARMSARHSPNITHPEETWKVLSAFLSRVTGASA